jgi:type IV secretion system protein VirB9
MKPQLLCAAVLTLAAATAAPAIAEETPRGGHADPRITAVDYDPQQVVRIVGVIRTATQVRFSPQETILHVALGDSSGWEVAPARDVLFAKPVALKSPTNLLVTTELPDGSTRHYAFELSSRAGAANRASPNTFFVVQFRYPADEKARLQKALSAQAQALEARIVQLKLDRGVLEGPRNLAYELQGSPAIAPSEVTDNGRFTVLRFPGGQAMPAAYSVAPDGTEGLAPFDVRGEFLVLHLTAAQLRLRRGREVLCIFNRAYQPAGAPTGTATSAKDVDRTGPKEAQP